MCSAPLKNGPGVAGTVRQERFDYSQEVLVRLARTDKVDEGDFSYYFLDLAYSDLQPDLFRHVFPACLKYWYDTLMRDDSASSTMRWSKARSPRKCFRRRSGSRRSTFTRWLPRMTPFRKLSASRTTHL